MGLEIPTFISDLVPTNPLATDTKGQGDDHIRNLKTALQNTFPNASKAFRFPSVSSKSTSFSVLSSEVNITFLVDTTAAAVTATLPTLVAGDAGWECFFIKTNAGVNPVFIAPPSGTIQSGAYTGLTKTRRCIPGTRTRVVWTGSAFIAERVVDSPVGAILDFDGATLPVGFEWPNGQTLASASTNYPDYNSVKGSGITADLRGRVGAGKDDMGGTAANRITSAGSGITGTTLDAAGGSQTQTLTQANLPSGVTLTTNIASGQGSHGHTVSSNAITSGGNSLDSGPFPAPATNAATITVNANTLPAMTGTTDLGGSGTGHINVQPTIIMNKILVVE